ncbi:unnamed protein product [Brassica napus]|uniref:(rape) hypothetical protein n=1 Tax=Brassica napus TaxID=3708 RepID=A0A816KBR3_BRANA|nr:unnamed protein product [Brassica napus]
MLKSPMLKFRRKFIGIAGEYQLVLCILQEGWRNQVEELHMWFFLEGLEIANRRRQTRIPPEATSRSNKNNLGELSIAAQNRGWES